MNTIPPKKYSTINIHKATNTFSYRRQGFTLIELIVVILILGILSATATPKLIDMRRNARIAVLKGVEAAARAADVLVYSTIKIMPRDPQKTSSAYYVDIPFSDGTKRLQKAPDLWQ